MTRLKQISVERWDWLLVHVGVGRWNEFRCCTLTCQIHTVKYQNVTARCLKNHDNLSWWNHQLGSKNKLDTWSASMWIEKAWLPCFPPRGQQVLHQIENLRTQLHTGNESCNRGMYPCRQTSPVQNRGTTDPPEKGLYNLLENKTRRVHTSVLELK